MIIAIAFWVMAILSACTVVNVRRSIGRGDYREALTDSFDATICVFVAYALWTAWT
jgi:hypothetical protein